MSTIISLFIKTIIIFLSIHLLTPIILHIFKKKRKKHKDAKDIINTIITNLVIFVTVFSGVYIVSDILSNDITIIDPPPSPSSTSSPSPTLNAPAPLTIIANWTPRFDFTDINAVITAKASVEVEFVELRAKMGSKAYDTWTMRSNNQIDWSFNASFYEHGTFEVSITAYGFLGEIATTYLEINYPNDW